MTCFTFFGAWTDFFTNSGRKPGQVCRNCFVGGQTSLLHKTNVSGKDNSLSCFWFRIFSVRSFSVRLIVCLVFDFGFKREVSGLSAKKQRQFVICQKWIPSLYRKNLRTKNWNFSRSFFQIFGGNISKFQLITWWHLCRNCLESVQSNHLGKKWKIFFSFWMMSWKFLDFWQKNGTSVKTAFYYSTGTFWGNKLTCFSFFWNLNRIFFQIWLITWGKFFGTALYVPRRAIWRKQMCLGKLIV